ncbi:MAG: hypothetical protein WCC57_17050, partial [Paracoccaceae bacterium]
DPAKPGTSGQFQATIKQAHDQPVAGGNVFGAEFAIGLAGSDGVMSSILRLIKVPVMQTNPPFTASARTTVSTIQVMRL